MVARYQALLWPALWFTTVVVGLLSRTYWPVDETRYLGVAWEMWSSEDWLVPHMNGAPYSDKPPMLFWLIVSGWKVFGVNAWWPRILPSLFALGSLVMAGWLGRRLWPDERRIDHAALLVLHGALLWPAFTGLLMFDMLVVFFVLVAFAGLLISAQRPGLGGWLLAGLAIGLGLISKGPVVLLFILPPALAAPMWAVAGRRQSWGSWYAGVVASVVVGAAVALCWAIPAAKAGGTAYADAIFLGQTAHRLAGGAAPHSRPLWAYLAMLPVITYPWLLWPPLWRGLIKLDIKSDAGSRFCLAVILPALVLLSLVESKQPQYLLPLFPVFALLAGRSLKATTNDIVRRRDNVLPAIALLMSGVALAILPSYAVGIESIQVMQKVSSLWGLLVILVALGLFALPNTTSGLAVVRWSVISTVFLVILQVGPLQALAPENDTRPIAKLLSQFQRDETPVAWLRAYNDQVHFAGRLTRPLDVISDHELPSWIEKNTEGVIVNRYATWNSRLTDCAIYAQRYRGGAIALFRASQLSRCPELMPAIKLPVAVRPR